MPLTGERLRLSHLVIDEDGLPANVAAMLLAIVRGYGTRRWARTRLRHMTTDIPRRCH
jgi:hypothetical protein